MLNQEIFNTERERNARKSARAALRETEHRFCLREAQSVAGSVEARRLANIRHLFSLVRSGQSVHPDEALRQLYGLGPIIPLRQTTQSAEVVAR